MSVSNPSLLHCPDFGLGSVRRDESGDVSASVGVEESEPEASFSEDEGDASEGGCDFPEPPEEAKLFVENLAYDMRTDLVACSARGFTGWGKLRFQCMMDRRLNGQQS
ncbi:hypothetical protein HID58_041856 [Brassica napus]|uniref:Uncharacterized protein n=1 Tax=Brassica napus TaxID=3708 RepID=A0ABQ8BCA1_BRANA|nr:hypothetical protein HID58_041856 [Brassica napus]